MNEIQKTKLICDLLDLVESQSKVLKWYQEILNNKSMDFKEKNK